MKKFDDVIRVNLDDVVKVSDKFQTGKPKKHLTGHVKIRAVNADNKTLYVVEKDNLIVDVGRNWLMQRAFNVDYSTTNQKSNHYIFWFSVGSGAASPSDPFNPVAPNANDTELFNIVILDASNTNYAANGTKKPYTNLAYTGEMEAVVTIEVERTEANGNLINEAGLYVADSNDPTAVSEFTMFSHVTFPSIHKTDVFALVFEWTFRF